MSGARRLVTTADVDLGQPHPDVQVAARHELELADGRRVLLLDDRGWGSTGPWAAVTVEQVQETTRVVVGPDEPFGHHSPQDVADDHWTALAHDAQRHGVAVQADELRQLPHDVVLTPRLLARLRRPS